MDKNVIESTEEELKEKNFRKELKELLIKYSFSLVCANYYSYASSSPKSAIPHIEIRNEKGDIISYSYGMDLHTIKKEMECG